MISLTKIQRVQRNRGPGFTLLELIFVAAILIIVVTLAIPRFGKTFNFLQLQNFASDTVSFARYAQTKAITDAKEHRLVFDTDKRVMRIESRLETEEEDEWYAEKVKPIPKFVSVELEGVKNDIKFYPDGHADEAIVWVIVNSDKKYKISVEPATGYVKLEEAKKE